MKLYFQVVFLLCLSVVSLCKEKLSSKLAAVHRDITGEVTPGCNKTCAEKGLTLMHITAKGANDELHFIWDFIGPPSILMAVTPVGTNLTIDWDRFLAPVLTPNATNISIANSITFSNTPTFTYGLHLSRLIEFNDVSDSGRLDEVKDPWSDVVYYPMDAFNWMGKNPYWVSNTEFSLPVEAVSYNDTRMGLNATFQCKLTAFQTIARGTDLPHLVHTANSTQVDLVLQGIPTNRKFKKSRFGLEMLFVQDNSGPSSNATTIDEFTIHVHKSLDDEYTPGVFKTYHVASSELFHGVSTGVNSAYIQWRPVGYTTSERDINDSTDVKNYTVTQLSTDDRRSLGDLNRTMLYAFYGDRLEGMVMRGTNVTFGAPGDAFYRQLNYTAWTFIVGYGDPPEDQLSFLIIVVISIGLGMPAFLILTGGLFVMVKRNNSPDDNDDEDDSEER